MIATILVLVPAVPTTMSPTTNHKLSMPLTAAAPITNV